MRPAWPGKLAPGIAGRLELALGHHPDARELTMGLATGATSLREARRAHCGYVAAWLYQGAVLAKKKKKKKIMTVMTVTDGTTGFVERGSTLLLRTPAQTAPPPPAA